MTMNEASLLQSTRSRCGLQRLLLVSAELILEFHDLFLAVLPCRLRLGI